MYWFKSNEKLSKQKMAIKNTNLAPICAKNSVVFSVTNFPGISGLAVQFGPTGFGPSKSYLSPFVPSPGPSVAVARTAQIGHVACACDGSAVAGVVVLIRRKINSFSRIFKTHGVVFQWIDD